MYKQGSPHCATGSWQLYLWRNEQDRQRRTELRALQARQLHQRQSVGDAALGPVCAFEQWSRHSATAARTVRQDCSIGAMSVESTSIAFDNDKCPLVQRLGLGVAAFSRGVLDFRPRLFGEHD